MDVHKFESFPDNYFDCLVDIGACVGEISLKVSKRNNNVQIYCYEPNKINYANLEKATKDNSKFKLFNVALGDGTKMYMRSHKRKDSHVIIKENGEYEVATQRLSDMFQENEIDTTKKVAVKIDCEGGERYIIGHIESEKCLIECEHVIIEVHFKHEVIGTDPNPQWQTYPSLEEYDKWIRDLFDNTHEILYWNESKREGYGHFVLTKKN